MQSIPMSELLSSWWDLRKLIAERVGSYRRAEAVLGGMKLQAVYGECFASAAFLGGGGLLSNKAWLRCLHQLVADGLVDVERRVRPEGSFRRDGQSLKGTWGTFSTDFRRLWAWAMSILRRMAGSNPWRKMKGHLFKPSWSALGEWVYQLGKEARKPPGGEGVLEGEGVR